jgi:hypothetical protein
VSVGVERQRDGRVAKPFLDDLAVLTRRHQQRGVAVAKVIEPDGRQSGAPKYRLEVPIHDVLCVEQPAELIREDQILVLVQAKCEQQKAPPRTGGRIPPSQTGKGRQCARSFRGSGYNPHRPIFRDLLRSGAGRLAYAVFDLLWVNGRDLRGLSLTKRKARLDRVLPENGPTVFKVLAVEEHGCELFQAVQQLDFEGIVAKRKADPYGPKTSWYKIKNPAYTQAEGRGELFEPRGHH